MKKTTARPDGTPAIEKSTQAATGLSVLAATAGVLAATCCVLPIALTILGLGGAWLALLGFFAANRPTILIGGLLLLLLAVGLAVQAYRRNRLPNRSIIILIIAAILLGTAFTAPLWERDATIHLWNIWVNR